MTGSIPWDWRELLKVAGTKAGKIARSEVGGLAWGFICLEIGTEWDHPVFQGQDPTVDQYLFVVFQCLFQFERFGDSDRIVAATLVWTVGFCGYFRFAGFGISDRIVAATLVGWWFEGEIFMFFRE